MLVSVITICLNEQESLRETCESICCQISNEFEWIVIDGGSTDGSLEIFEKYRERIAVFISEKDSGVYDAMNKGIGQASGDYFVFLNAGDCFFREDIIKLIKEAPRVDLIVGDLACIDANGETKIKKFQEPLPRNFLRHNMLPHQATFFNSRLFKKFGLYDTSYRIAGDYEYYCRLIREGITIKHIPVVFSSFNLGGISSTERSRTLRKIENHRVRKKYFAFYKFSFECIKMEIKTLLQGIKSR